MEENKDYRVYRYGDDLKPGYELKVEHSVSCENVDISALIAMGTESLEAMRQGSIDGEQKAYEIVLAAAKQWEQQAAATQTINRALEYLRTPEIAHTSNQWRSKDSWRDGEEISNRVYKMTCSVWEDTKYDRETKQSIPVAWYVTWDVYVNSPILMMTKGNRQYVSNVFGDTNWLPYVTSYYGYRVHPISGEKNYHKAVDIGMPQGTEILAGHDGVVTQAGEAGSYGLIVVLEGAMEDGKTLTTKYAHCSELLVSAGQEVKQGDVIAKVGSTGDSTGPHLHLEVLVDGQYLNPLYFTDTGDHTGTSLIPGSAGGPEIPAYPGAPMGDGDYAALITEAQKHLGKPYVFGASGPNSFDCSGFVSYVLNQSGVASVGRSTAQGLFNMSTPVSRENAQPGDLIFFTGTYSAGTPVTHVGIYIGNGQMIHAGDPVQYANINTSYWTEHFYAFGRISTN